MNHTPGRGGNASSSVVRATLYEEFDSFFSVRALREAATAAQRMAKSAPSARCTANSLISGGQFFWITASHWVLQRGPQALDVHRESFRLFRSCLPHGSFRISNLLHRNLGSLQGKSSTRPSVQPVQPK
jgi:hypothetical protein